MTGLAITCDRQDGLVRVAVWRGKELRDLYLDRLDRPDPTGAVVTAKVARVLAGQKAAYVEAGAFGMAYVENSGSLRSGDLCTIRIKCPARQGKAAVAALVVGDAPAQAGDILAPPPTAWQCALADIGDEKIAALTFAEREDYLACQRLAPTLAHALRPLAKEKVHPELDEQIESLIQARVALPNGASLVIEATEALTAIDVNGGESGNALAVNLLAVKEAARQIRLRNIGGIIILDCLKTKERADKAKVLNALTRATADDPAGAQIFGMTKLGLIELTRTRRGLSLDEVMATTRRRWDDGKGHA